MLEYANCEHCECMDSKLAQGNAVLLMQHVWRKHTWLE